MGLGGTTSTCLVTTLLKKQNKQIEPKTHHPAQYCHNVFHPETHKTKSSQGFNFSHHERYLGIKTVATSP